MSIISKFSKVKRPMFSYRLGEGHNSYTLADLWSNYPKQTVYPVAAMFTRCGKYGEQATLIIPNCVAPEGYVSLPKHLTVVVKDMLSDPECCEAIEKGFAGFSVYQYTLKDGRTGYSVEWVDFDSPKTLCDQPDGIKKCDECNLPF